MSLAANTPNDVFLSNALAGAIEEFPPDSQNAARSLVKRISRLMVELEGRLRTDVDAELQALRAKD